MRILSRVAVGAAMVGLAPLLPAQEPQRYTEGELRALAREVHPSLESARAGVEAALGALRGKRLRADPRLAASLGRGEAREGGATRTEWGVELSQALELGWLRRGRVRHAEADVRAAEVERHAAEAAVDAAVATLFHGVLIERAALGIAEEGADIARRLLDLTGRRVAAGESAPLDELQARSEWFARRQEQLVAGYGLEAARAALDAFLLDRLEPGFEVAGDLGSVEARPLPHDLAARGRAGNPEVARARAAVEVAAAGLDLARAARVPGLELSLARESELDREATAVGLVLSVPLWNRGRGEVDEAAAVRARDDAALREATAVLDRELARLRAEHDAARASLGLHEEGWRATAGRVLDIAVFRFENGEGSMIEVLDAQRSYLAVRQAEIEARARLVQARGAIEALLGASLVTEEPDRGSTQR